MPDTETAPKRYLNANQVRQRYGGASHMWLERRLENDPTFPRPIKPSRFRLWDEAELEAWERGLATKSA